MGILLPRLFLLLTLLPVAEIALLVWVANRTSVLLVVSLVIGTAIVGTWLARRQGLRTLVRIQSDLAAGRAPANSLLDGLLILAAAVLLVLPGFLSDVVAVVLLVPATRALVKAWLRLRFAARLVGGTFTHFRGTSAGDDDIIDVEVVESPSRNLPS